jgi:hypothetical protein
MRKRFVWLGLILILRASGLAAQANPVKVCIIELDEGYDALRLARQLSSRKLESGAPLVVVAITGKELSAKEEQDLAAPGTPFVRVLATEKNAKDWDAEVERLRCDYNIRVSYHESADSFDSSSLACLPNPAPRSPSIPPSGDRTKVGYELRKAGSRKVIARAVAPPLTVYVRQGRREFNPYILFADQIVKKLNRVN